MTALERIRSSTELRDLLFELCDFELAEAGLPPWIRFPEDSTAVPFGRDGSGGIFVMLRRHGDAAAVVIHASSEGSAGCLGASLDEFFALIAALPHWRDCLKFSAGGSLAEMRRCAPPLAVAFQDEIDDYESKAERLATLLDITAPADPILTLHQAIGQHPDPVAFAPGDGSPFAGLFNTHTRDEASE